MRDSNINSHDKLKIINLGSTYAMYAFQYSYVHMEHTACNLANSNQSLANDYNLLQQYISKLYYDSLVIQVLSPCVMLFNGPDSITKTSLVKQKMRKSLDYLKKALGYPPKSNKNYIESLLSVWKNLFGLENFFDVNLSDSNIRSIKRNGTILREMINLSTRNGLKTIIVIPPFSNKINHHFSDDFVATVLMSNLPKENGIPVLVFDYRKNDIFQDKYEWYIDGGFCLNAEGSKVFMKLLWSDLINAKVLLPNISENCDESSSTN